MAFKGVKVCLFSLEFNIQHHYFNSGFSPGFFEGATPKGEGAGGGGTPSCMRKFLKYEDEMVLPGWFQINVLE